ncbi:MAG TPA: hypothetical protein VJ997_11750 [Longimicrobiales bacterium]|nr:hypothetical protein [Longimicrobiales bacterium]
MNKKLVVALIALAVAFAVVRLSRDAAPVADGSFLRYQQGSSTVRLTFHSADGGKYRTVVEVAQDGGPPEVATGMTGHGETVDGLMRTGSGSYFELGPFGPLWVQPGQLKEGGSAYGSRVREIKPWHGRDVAVVSAALGMGTALRGEWYYDVATGFLVGGMKSTAVSGPGQGFELVEANVPGLVVP